MSETLGGIGSAAISAVPVLEKTNATSGKAADRPLDLQLHRVDWVKRGARDAHGVHGDVLLVQRRHEFLAEPREQHGPTRRAADGAARRRSQRREAPASAAARRARFSPRINRFSFSCTRPGDQIATIAGTKVSDSTNAAAERDDHRQRHRLEHLALDAREGQDRHVDQ